MLELKVLDEDREVILRFEHSLLSVSKWESRRKIAFLTNRQKTNEELIEYFQDMLLGETSPNLVFSLSPDQQTDLVTYMNTPQTASSVPDDGKKKFNSETITSELIYFWMVALKINWEAETWHLSRLMMLVQIVNHKQQPVKKRNPREVLSDWSQQNEERKKRFGISG